MTIQSLVERELKFDVEPGFVLPDVSGLVPDGGRVEHETQHLRSDYFDTVDHALLSARMTLRRRIGDADSGWQLKVPQEPFREELRLPPAGEGVPEELRRLLVGVTRSRLLVQVASVVTEREVMRLVDSDGTRLAEIDDDRVHACGSGRAATAISWREVEVELGEDELELLYALGARLQRAGARASSSTSKLQRVLDDGQRDPAKRTRTAGEVLSGYLAEQQRVILAGDLALRRGEEAAVHQTRVASRRLRSTLRTFRWLVDPSRADALDAELRWFAGMLGEVRDRQVLRRRLDAMIDELDDTLLLGPVRARVDTELHYEQRERWNTLRQELAGARYLALLDGIAAWTEQTPWSPAASRPASTLSKALRSAGGKLTRRLRLANTTGDAQMLHSARKAAKRARYAAEAMEPVLGVRASTRQAKRYQRLQDLLGEHQDSLVSAAVLRRLGAKAGTISGENGFTFGLLYEREEQKARAARADARRRAKKYR